MKVTLIKPEFFRKSCFNNVFHIFFPDKILKSSIKLRWPMCSRSINFLINKLLNGLNVEFRWPMCSRSFDCLANNYQINGLVNFNGRWCSRSWLNLAITNAIMIWPILNCLSHLDVELSYLFDELVSQYLLNWGG